MPCLSSASSRQISYSLVPTLRMAQALKLFIDECLPERLPQQRREPSRNSLVVSSRICVERVWRSERTKVRLGKGKFRSRGRTRASAPTCNVTLHAYGLN